MYMINLWSQHTINGLHISSVQKYLFFVLFPHQLQGDGPKRFKFEHFKINKRKEI